MFPLEMFPVRGSFHCLRIKRIIDLHSPPGRKTVVKQKAVFLRSTSHVTAVQQPSGILFTLLQSDHTFARSLAVIFPVFSPSVFMFPAFGSRTKSGLSEPAACFLQGAGPRGLRGLAVEEERRQGLLFPEVEEVLVCPQGQLLVLVHQ